MNCRLRLGGHSVPVLRRLVNARNDYTAATNVLCRNCKVSSFEEDRMRIRQEQSAIRSPAEMVWRSTAQCRRCKFR